MKTFDFIVVGGGSAGFHAARVAASLGKRVALVDGAKQLGGLCILKGCMPSKTLLYVAKLQHLARHGNHFGLNTTARPPDMAKVLSRKAEIIEDFRSFREKQLRRGKFQLVRATATFISKSAIKLSNGQILTAKKFMIATGSEVQWPSVPGLSRKNGVLTSDEILHLNKIPKRITILGGGVVACELGQYLSRMGARVTFLQRSDRILKHYSPQTSATIKDAFAEEGIRVVTGVSLQKVEKVRKKYLLTAKIGNKKLTVSSDLVFNALGRRPFTQSLGLEKAGVNVDERGQIRINRFQQTTNKNIYAGGDCSGPVEIVHIAVAQGELAARHAFKRKTAKPIRYDQQLDVVFTEPQVARAGISTDEAKDRGIKTIAATYPFNDHGKSILMNELHGYVKVIAEKKTGRILGAEMVGPEVGEMIHFFTIAISAGLTAQKLASAAWYHPTLSEIVTYPLEEIAESFSK